MHLDQSYTDGVVWDKSQNVEGDRFNDSIVTLLGKTNASGTPDDISSRPHCWYISGSQVESENPQMFKWRWFCRTQKRDL